ncbi:4-hydroxymandelate oxidase [Motilibacter rhizosphaerae]|uniref:4-hydroxymandelate oxidase n=1 Tax=Motilibacter rhizosphaerae TaxID=598652 RepID=A0A4Q7NPZ3_9ACTN|nr:alpha-hydroxy acid oxidase [Motilibacter rhizosphaerae]RZS87395.1 4-hydroxymandelate oxidase [Motilibacter rhizosphaerae]
MTLRVLARQEAQAELALPRSTYDYYAGGSGEEITLESNLAGWRGYRLRPRVLRDVAEVDTSTEVLGTRLAAPVVVAPSALHGLAHPDGEVATAAGTADSGSLLCLSTRSSVPLEEVAAAGSGADWWFQVYVMRDRELTEGLVRRAAAHGAKALVLTGDTPYVGLKKRTTEGLSVGSLHLANLAQHVAGGVVDQRATEQDPGIGLDVIGWLHEVSGLPVVVKGVLRGDDARDCVSAGAGGVLVSNHGGRQLDRAVPTALALPEVVEAVGAEVPVLVDGGVRTGVDALVALGLGASAVLLGRPVLWALAAAGRAGVTQCLDAVRADLAHVMALAGARSVAELPEGLVTR